MPCGMVRFRCRHCIRMPWRVAIASKTHIVGARYMADVVWGGVRGGAGGRALSM